MKRCALYYYRFELLKLLKEFETKKGEAMTEYVTSTKEDIREALEEAARCALKRIAALLQEPYGENPNYNPLGPLVEIVQIWARMNT